MDLMSRSTIIRCVAILVTAFCAGTPSNAIAQINCSAWGANPNDDNPDDAYLQQCFNNAPAGSTVFLDPGSPGFLIDYTVTIPKNLTVTSSQAPTRATILAGHNLRDFVMEQLDINMNWTITYISFSGMNDTLGWRNFSDCNTYPNLGNLWFRGTGFTFAHNESKNAICGTGLQIAGNSYYVWDNYIAYNGTDAWNGGPWADGITALRCNGGSIHHNVFVDNTDIDLVVGGGPSCTVYNNTIWHGGKYSFAGLNLGNFGDSSPYDGKHYLSQFTGNTITNTVADRLGHGLSVGAHPWSVAVWISDTGSVSRNDIAGANVNLLIEGTTGNGTAGNVTGNTISNPSGNRDCGGAYNYLVNPNHATAGQYDSGYTGVIWDFPPGGCFPQ